MLLSQEGVRPFMATTEDTRKKLIGYVEDIYALESHLVQVLQDHLKDAQNVPMFQQKIEQHLRETELHRDRMEQRLNALGGSKPGLKTTMTNILGQMLGGLAGTRADTLVKNARDDYASEHLEIASYVELITLAQSVGDVDTVRAAQLNLRDEVAFQQWLIQHLPEAMVQSLQRDGIQVPASAVQNVQNIFADAGIGTFGAQQQPFQQPFQQPPAQQPPPAVS
jgi:ferritin-like metal-binding protein YciE